MPRSPDTIHHERQIAGDDPMDVQAGREWMVEAFDCNEDRLRDLRLITEVCQLVVADLGLNVLGQPQTHRFPGPGGVTAMYMLSESHLTCHTYPELQLATFNLYCCREREAWPWSRELQRRLSAAAVKIRVFERGLSTLQTEASAARLAKHASAETLP